MQLTKEQYKQMSSEILELSVSVWDNELLGCEDGIKLNDLWPILDKYLKAEEDIKTVWDFVTAYFPNYYNSDLIALADDLQKIIDEEAEPESDAHDYFVNECNEDMAIAKQHYEETHRRIYEMAIGGYLQSLKNNG